jgi:hypothetical protein
MRYLVADSVHLMAGKAHPRPFLLSVAQVKSASYELNVAVPRISSSAPGTEKGLQPLKVAALFLFLVRHYTRPRA